MEGLPADLTQNLKPRPALKPQPSPVDPAALQAICSSTAHPELKWIAGFCCYQTEVQPWNDVSFNYISRLKGFVDGGMSAGDTSLIDAVSGIVNRGCPALSCAAGPVDGVSERRDNFRKC